MKLSSPVCTAILVSLVGVATPAVGQPVLEGTEALDFDRPEAWAMKRSASLTLLTALGPPRNREGGVVEVALELAWNPDLSEEERRVGFNGTKVEDLNRVAVVPRPRITVGLGHNWSLDAAYLPPIEVEGITPNVASVAIERPVWSAQGWAVGIRGHGQAGTVKGDITCTEHEAGIPPGEPGNEFGCEEPSQDEVILNYAGFGLTGGYRFADTNDSAFHFGVFANYMDLEFQVDALTFGIRDRTTLVTEGWTYSLTAGFSLALGQPTRIALEAFYSPLDVDRPVRDGDPGPPRVEPRNDSLFNLRAMLTYVF